MRISREEYHSLRSYRERLQWIEGDTVPANPGRGGRSPIDRDPDLARFIRTRLGRLTCAEIAALCAKQFGAGRAPSKSAIHRFWQRLNGS